MSIVCKEFDYIKKVIEQDNVQELNLCSINFKTDYSDICLLSNSFKCIKYCFDHNITKPIWLDGFQSFLFNNIKNETILNNILNILEYYHTIQNYDYVKIIFSRIPNTWQTYIWETNYKKFNSVIIVECLDLINQKVSIIKSYMKEKPAIFDSYIAKIK